MSIIFSKLSTVTLHFKLIKNGGFVSRAIIYRCRNIRLSYILKEVRVDAELYRHME